MAARKKKDDGGDRWRVIRGSNDPTESDVKDAVSLLQAHYYRSVKSHALSLIQEIKDGDIKSRDDLETRINEDADGSSWVIYPYWGRMVLFVSDNYDAYEEEMGEKPTTTEQAVYGAFAKDLTEQLNAEADGDVEALFERDEDDED